MKKAARHAQPICRHLKLGARVSSRVNFLNENLRGLADRKVFRTGWTVVGVGMT